MTDWSDPDVAAALTRRAQQPFWPTGMMIGDGQGHFLVLLDGEIDDSDDETLGQLADALTRDPSLTLAQIPGWWRRFL